MVKLGVSAFAWTRIFDRSHLRLLPQVRDYGFQAFEIPMFHPFDLPVDGLRKSFDVTGLECTVCAILPPGINPISPSAAVRKRSAKHLAACVETAAGLGAKLLGGPIMAPSGYAPGYRPTGDEWRYAVDALQSLIELLDKHRMMLSIEPVNRAETFFIRTALDARQLCDAIDHPRIGVTIDTFHANIEEKSIPDAMERLGSRLFHLHASENDRGLLGTGHVDFPAILKALRRNKYDGCLMIEGFGYMEEERSAPGYLWANRTVSPADIARDGRIYLTRLLQQLEEKRD